jgi:adenylate cyclase
MRGHLIGKILDVFRTWWRHKVSFAISVSITVAALAFYFFTFLGERPTPLFESLQRFELNTLDTRFRYRAAGSVNPDPRIIIVDIDQRSQEVLGRWPFSRTHFAHMLDALKEDGARVVAFDVTFSKPDEASEPIRTLRAQVGEWKKQGVPIDPRLAAKLAALEAEYNSDGQLARSIEHFGPVVLGNFFLYTQADLAGLDDATLDRYAALLAFFSFPQVRPVNPQAGKQDLENVIRSYADLGLVPRGAQANIDVLTDALRGEHAATGFFNIPADTDGVVRRALLALPYGRSQKYEDWDFYASIDVQAARLFLGLTNDKTVLQFGPTGVVNIEFGPDLRVQPDPVGRAMINYRGPVRTYPFKSLADVVSHKFPPGTFRDKIVLVGASATGIGDLRTTPYGGVDYPGVEIHANIIDNILNRNFLVRGAKQVELDLAAILMFGVPVGFWLALTRPRWMWLGLLLLVPFIGGVYAAFLRGWWLNLSTPALTLVANVGLVSLYRVLIEEKEKRRIHGAFEQYVTPEVIRRLLKSPELVQPRKTEISVMFSDIRGFTSFSEKLDAQVLATVLNKYLTEMTRLVFGQQGTLDKYIGDAVMAFWGAPNEDPRHAEHACRTALAMMQRLGELQGQWQVELGSELNIGIGIHSGMASVGNMGSELRYGYTAMGDTVNLASRLEGMNKEYGTNILVTESCYEAARNAGFVFRELDVIRVKGKSLPVTIYELVMPQNGSGEPVERLEMFARARARYHQRQWREAQELFERVLERWPNDGPSRTYWKRCQEYLFEEPESNWDGVFVMSHK